MPLHASIIVLQVYVLENAKVISHFAQWKPTGFPPNNFFWGVSGRKTPKNIFQMLKGFELDDHFVLSFEGTVTFGNAPPFTQDYCSELQHENKY